MSLVYYFFGTQCSFLTASPRLSCTSCWRACFSRCSKWCLHGCTYRGLHNCSFPLTNSFVEDILWYVCPYVNDYEALLQVADVYTASHSKTLNSTR